MRCEDWQERIFERHGLEPLDRQELDQHLLTCAICFKWAEALNEVDAELRAQLHAEVSVPDLRPRILGHVARERRRLWITAISDLMDAVGWSIVGILAMAGLFLWSNWVDWIATHLLSAGAATLVGSLMWAARVLSKEDSDLERRAG
jgi:predicted anti-sigma-YlaC factor YlaD